ncbi:DEAD/DEAH box helicase [Mycolicibacterium brumae]|uniref:DEAD/DEAH box helicase n=1 Tax=Mycolicibacterium brumae TaxID=85968 RepID=UPI001F42C508|nr:DEAD/DEAH box helicase [Mycolicibacterium brumae]
MADELTGAREKRATEVIEALAGPGARLRDDQRRAVAALLEPSARVLVVQATGWGKSAVYWAATAIRRDEGAGPALIVSPLLSLMRDQVVAAGRAGLRAATLNSSNFDEWNAIEAQLANGEIDVLLVSPERLANPSFGRRVLAALEGALGLLVIDEAHSVSDWGHDFRPDYRRVSDVLTRLNPQTPVLATTATANARVTDDVAAQLGNQPLVLRGPLARRSLQLNVLPAMSPLARYGWVVDNLESLPGSGIVYVLTVADAQRLVDAIHAVRPDTPVAAYTGQLDADARAGLEDALRENRVKALIATSALGMGFDKPDLGFVVHIGSPPSPVSYYQQVGRAGRAIDHAVVALLPSPADAGIWDYFATASIPDPGQMARVLAALADESGAGPPYSMGGSSFDSAPQAPPSLANPPYSMGGSSFDSAPQAPPSLANPPSVVTLEASTGIRRTRIELMLKQLAVDGAVERLDGGWRATGKPWSYDAEHYESVIATRRREAEIMRAYTRGQRCLMQLLTESLDDPAAAACGRCSVCLGDLPDAMGDPAGEQTMRTVAATLRANTLVLEPRKMWPGGVFGARGRIPATLVAEPGRVLVHADAPEWTGVIAAASAGDPAAAAELSDAAIGALTRWRNQWAHRPEVVVSLQLIGSGSPAQPVADRIAEVGRLARAQFPVPGDAPPGRDASGAEEAAHWRAALKVTPELAEEVSGKTVLLTVDSSGTGWPVTVAAAKLREAGATAVLPLLIHRPA